jgi:hypothetical protein
VDEALSALGSLIAQLPDLTAEAMRSAPLQWRRDHQDVELWLQGIEFHADGLVRMLYDFGDLDMLVLESSGDGDRRVTIER